MPREVVVTVGVDLLEVSTGEWCSTCLLPSAVIAHLAIKIGERLTVEACRYCADCGWTYE